MRILDVLGLRLAEPGEFTKRAFLAGRMDLTEAEGLADLVAAETEAQRRLALGTMEGSIRSQYESWRDRIIQARGLIEAELDFSDEEGVAGAWSARGKEGARAIAAELRAALTDLKRGQRIREGASVVIAGAVNAGKSSLINAIARRDVAIVSPEPGTTRDLIEIAADLAGFRVTLVDTAGFRETEGAVEREGMRRARNRAEEADLVLWLWADGSELTPPPGIMGWIWFVGTKSDLMDHGSRERARSLSRHVISTVSGDGIQGLLDDIGAFLSRNLRPAEPAIVTRSRHAKSLMEAALSLDDAVGCADAVIAAEHLRRASDAIGRVTGRVDVEDVLDVVFREFCIGK
jgi:tRNA modification GTPase